MFKISISGLGLRFGPVLVERIRGRLGRLRTVVRRSRRVSRSFGARDEKDLLKRGKFDARRDDTNARFGE